jgi:hypothetical protein
MDTVLKHAADRQGGNYGAIPAETLVQAGELGNHCGLGRGSA